MRCQAWKISGYPKSPATSRSPTRLRRRILELLLEDRMNHGVASVAIGRSSNRVAPATERVVKRRDLGPGSGGGAQLGASRTPWPPIAPSGGDSLSGLRDASLIALTSDAMLRVSEVAAL